MMNADDIEIKFSSKNLPLEYKILEWRLTINKKLYNEKKIDINVYSEMENNLLGRMTKIKNEYSKKLIIK